MISTPNDFETNLPPPTLPLTRHLLLSVGARLKLSVDWSLQKRHITCWNVGLLGIEETEMEKKRIELFSPLSSSVWVLVFQSLTIFNSCSFNTALPFSCVSMAFLFYSIEEVLFVFQFFTHPFFPFPFLIHNTTSSLQPVITTNTTTITTITNPHQQQPHPNSNSKQPTTKQKTKPMMKPKT